MRKQLKKIEGERHTFAGTFVRYGSKSAYRGAPIKTLLFHDICDSTGAEVAGHIWFTDTKGFDRAGPFVEGDRVQFDARVTEYTKGYKGRREDVWMENPLRTDYRLSWPTKIRIISSRKNKKKKPVHTIFFGNDREYVI